MRLDRAFHLSFYLTLATASACLFYALTPLVPELNVWVWPVTAAFIVAYLVEGRWSLGKIGAPLVFVLLAAAAGLRAAKLFTDPPPILDEVTLWALVVVPQLGWLLFVAMPAMLLLPKSGWRHGLLYFMAFVMVGLSCMSDSDFFIAFFLLAFFAVSLWSLALYYVYHEQFLRKERASIAPWRGAGFWQAALRAGVAIAIGTVLFLFIPRPSILGDDSPLRAPQIQTGVGAVIDLNSTGTIQINTAVAFQVVAEDAKGAPKLDLDQGQRWRALVLNHYQSGQWFHKSNNPYIWSPPPEMSDRQPNLGPDQYFLRFQFPTRLTRILVLAEPIMVPPPDQPAPVVFYVTKREDGAVDPYPAIRQHDGDLRTHPQAQGTLLHYCRSYRQVTRPPEEAGWNIPNNLDEEKNPRKLELQALTRLPDMPDLLPWTDRLLQKLVAQNRLQPRDVASVNDWLPPRNHLNVAQALERYLSTSGDYSYSLKLARHDRTMDPILDFLFNVKQGHCERFASALVVMLRCKGIPARIVVGYRGCEPQREGRYFIRQSNAHSWVEALVQRPGPDGELEWRWLTLDPTAGEDAGSENLTSWGRAWKSFQDGGNNTWRNLVMEYGANRQSSLLLEATDGTRQAARSLAKGEVWPWTIVALATLSVGLLVYRSRRKRRRGTLQTLVIPEAGFYARWLGIVARHWKLVPDPAQTPREFAEMVHRQLEKLPTASTFLDLPATIAALYYRVRYADLHLAETEATAIEARLDEFDSIVANPG